MRQKHIKVYLKQYRTKILGTITTEVEWEKVWRTSEDVSMLKDNTLWEKSYMDIDNFKSLKRKSKNKMDLNILGIITRKIRIRWRISNQD